MRLGGAARGKVFLELGSGDGRNLLLASAMGMHAVGYERSPILVGLGRARAALSRGGSEGGSVEIVRADFMEALSRRVGADLIFAYLSDEAMEKLAPRLSCAFGGTARTVVLVSRDFAVPGWGERERVQRGKSLLLAYTVPPPPPGAHCEAG